MAQAVKTIGRIVTQVAPGDELVFIQEQDAIVGQRDLSRRGVGTAAYQRYIALSMLLAEEAELRPLRACLARGLVTRPRILLMDEPFAALDEITRFKLNDDLLELWQERRFTVIFVTHSVFESVFLSNRITVMAAHPGRVFQELVVDAPYPRDDAFRTSAQYAQLCRTASGTLSRAMGMEDADVVH